MNSSDVRPSSFQKTDTNVTLADDADHAPKLTSYYGFPSDSSGSSSSNADQGGGPLSRLNATLSSKPRFLPNPSSNLTAEKKQRRSAFAPFQPVHKQHDNHHHNDNNLSLMSKLSIAIASNAGGTKHTKFARRAYISHIESPHQFHVQTPDFHTNEANAILAACNSQAAVAAVPPRIDTGHMYLLRQSLVHGSNSANATLWYRVRVRSASNESVDVVYVDFGNVERVRRDTADADRFRMISSSLAARQPGARACSLYALRTPDSSAMWHKEAKMLMSTIVAK